MPRINQFKDLTGEKFGKRTVLSFAGRDETKYKNILWETECECGTVQVVAATSLKENKSCGCNLHAHTQSFIDLLGQKFNQLLVTEPDFDYAFNLNKKSKGAYWKCLCDCGNHITVLSQHLRKGSIKNCGCVLKEKQEKYNILNKKFGKLTVIEKATNHKHVSSIKWKCQCECGKINYILASNLIKPKGIKSCTSCREMTEEVKNKISKKRKLYLEKNPDKHPWKAIKSAPCENVKKFLTQHMIDFIEEYSPLKERYFSIDIAIPEKKIAIEINGMQHYEKDKITLTPYYQNRHNLIEAAGWQVWEIPYRLAWKDSFLKDLIEKIFNTEKVLNFDYTEYFKYQESLIICKCGKSKSKQAKVCVKCVGERFYKPNKVWLHYLLWNYSLKKISTKLKMSGKTITNLAKKFNLNRPPQFFWVKYYRGHIIDYCI